MKWKSSESEPVLAVKPPPQPAVAQPPQRWKDWMYSLSNPILDTDFVNPAPAFDTTDLYWSAKQVGCSTFPRSDQPEWEWVPVLHPKGEMEGDQLVGVSGTVVNPKLSTHDIPFTHPFVSTQAGPLKPGFDYVFGVIPDSQYNNLMAPSNLDLSGLANPYQQDGDAAGGITDAKDYLKVNPGSIGGALIVETDEALLPNTAIPYAPIVGTSFRPAELGGDRAVVFGRWIVDAGHPFFQTEIHPPLAVAFARPVSFKPSADAADATFVSLISRPYLVGQVFEEGGGGSRSSRTHGLRQYFKDELMAAALRGNKSMDMKVKIYPPFNDPVQITFLVRPPRPRHSPKEKLLLSYHFTTQPGVDIAIDNYMEEDGYFRVTVFFQYATPIPRPPIALPNYPWILKDIASQLSDDDKLALAREIYNLIGANIGTGDALQGAEIIRNVTIGLLPFFWSNVSNPAMNAKYIVEQGGVRMDYYDAPVPGSGLDADTIIDMDTAQYIPSTRTIDNDPGHVFPIYGWMLLRWD